jgi:hypothetical protein
VVRYTKYMGKNIKFVSLHDNILKMFYPKPATECIPDWYKLQTPYSNNKKTIDEHGMVNATIKRCVPIFDSITAGYIIFTCMDIEVSRENNKTFFKWSTTFTGRFGNLNPISFHDPDQVSSYPSLKDLEGVAKFLNPWSRQTPKGYSVIFMTPMHRDLPFEILPGVVDTDKHSAEVHLPFFFKDPNWTGIIPAGTPIAQVIPFKRESWEMALGNEKDKEKTIESLKTQRVFFANVYRKMFWSKKTFK